MTDEEQELLEGRARKAFAETYPPAYLEKLAQESRDGRDLVELLWAGFVNGFAQGQEGRADVQPHAALQQIVANQEPLGEPFTTILNENRWKLYEGDEKPASES